MMKDIPQIMRKWGRLDHLQLAGGGLALLVLVILAFAIGSVSLEAIRGAVTVLVLLLVGMPILRRVARVEQAGSATKLLVVAAVAKLTFTFVRLFMIAVLYGGRSDAYAYSGWGAEIAAMVRRGDLSFLTRDVIGRTMETQRIATVTGLVYTMTGDSRYAGMLVFSAVCFAGQVLMWRAFRRAVPDGDGDRYGVLVFLLPSLLFWPSSIGKEALMLGCIGLLSYGAAQILGDSVTARGIGFFVLGCAGLLAIRPHMSLIAVVSLAVAAALGSIAGIRQRGASKSAIVRLGALVILIALGSVGVAQLGKLFAEDGSSDVGITAALERTQTQTGQGGSEFQPVAATSPADLPAAVVTVLFRPFPWEVRNFNGLIAASEGILLIVLFITGRRRLITWAKELPKNPYLVFCAVYAFVFIILFSYIGNFGILARQRTQMLPLVLVALSMQPSPKRDRRLAWSANSRAPATNIGRIRPGHLQQ